MFILVVNLCGEIFDGVFVVAQVSMGLAALSQKDVVEREVF